MSQPRWLPPLQPCDGAWPDVVAALYAIFDRDFRRGDPRFRGLPVWWDRTVQAGERYEEGFWHLITRDDRQTGDRLPDFRRAERLPWCRPAIDHEAEPEVVVWDYERGDRTRRTYVWLRDLDYVVVLERRALGRNRPGQTVMFLITAYHVDGDRSRSQLARSWEARVQ